MGGRGGRPALPSSHRRIAKSLHHERRPLRFVPVVPWPPSASAGLPLPFPRPPGPASMRGGEGGAGWPGLTSQQLLQRLWASRHRLALRGPRMSQRVGAGTCSVHTLSAGAALHRAGGRPWKHRSGGALPPGVPPSGSLFSFPEPSLFLEICGPTLPI